MKQIKKIPTGPIPDGYYQIEWTQEGAILRDKINEIIDAIVAVMSPNISTNPIPPTVPNVAPPRIICTGPKTHLPPQPHLPNNIRE